MAVRPFAQRSRGFPPIGSRACCGVLSVLIAICCTGCVVIPIRAPTKPQGASGTGPEKPDTTFIRDRQTTREQIYEQLAWTDTGVNSEKLFVGRWINSNWGVFWVAASEYQADSGWSRSWHQQTLLVAFDEQGAVWSHVVLKDTELTRELPAWLAKADPTPLELSPPLEVYVEDLAAKGATQARLVLEQDRFSFYPDESAHKKAFKRKFQIARAEVRGISVDWVKQNSEGYGPSAHDLCQKIAFTKKTPAGKSLSIRSDVPTMMTLFKYFAQTEVAPAQAIPAQNN